MTSKDLCDTLNHRIGTDARCDLVRAQLMHRKRRSGETLQELTQDIHWSVQIAEKDLPPVAWERLALERFMMALPHPEVRALLVMQNRVDE